MEEILTNSLLDFVGIQYTMMLQTLWKNTWLPTTRKFDTENKNWATQCTCPSCCDESIWCRYLQLTWGRWVCCLVVCTGCFTKCCEAKAPKDKETTTVSQYLCELIFKCGWLSIQINDQDWEFVNSVSAELHRLTGTIQRVTSAYHPQENDLAK